MSPPGGEQIIDVASIAEPEAAPSKAPDSKTAKEEEDLDKQEKQTRLRGLHQDIDERKKYAGRIFGLICSWLGGIFVLLLLQGLFGPHTWFALSDAVLIAAIGGTTINVIGIFVIVTRYLFPQPPVS